MRILITGNLGYVGAALCRYLRKQFPRSFLAGYDTGYFQHCLSTIGAPPENLLNVQYYGDVRTFDKALLSGIDHVIHLAAISNDPIGNRFEEITLDINYKATARLAKLAEEMGVKSFTLASSCSVYGAGGMEFKTEQSPAAPLTAYARSKVLAEEALASLHGEMVVTCLRFATACGMTDRLRLDIVLNDFVASAIARNEINILSDGKPWRPLIHVNDMCRAFHWAMLRQEHTGDRFLICNTGSNEWTFTVKELAQCVQNVFNGIKININPAAQPDKRSYRVSFDKFRSYAPQFFPATNITDAILELKSGLERIHFDDKEFQKSNFVRLNVLNEFIEAGALSRQLSWIREAV